MANVTWDEVVPIADEAFRIWVGNPERRWAQEAWAHLTKAGLTSYERQLDRVSVHIRFLVLASVYRDWCSLVFDEVEDDSPQLWLGGVETNPFYIGQLVADHIDLDDPEDSLDEALNFLILRERSAVVSAIIEGFGGVAGLFLALWRSNDTPDQIVVDDEEETPASETDADILNNGLTLEKLAGYQWICQGCGSRGPIRCDSEFDG